MHISVTEINSILIQADIEGLIELGAPEDEYEDEAAQIAAAISTFKDNELTRDTMLALVVVVWMKSFDLDDESFSLRMDAIMRTSLAIYELKHS